MELTRPAGAVLEPSRDRRRRWVVAGALAAVLLSLGPILDPDLPWHLAAGRRIFETGRIPRVDFLSWTMGFEPWVDFEWGSQAIFYGLLKAGGPAALWAFKSLLLCASGCVFAALLAAWELSGAWIGLGLVFYAAALFPVTTLRPEIFSLVFFELQLLVLERRRLGSLPVSDAALLVLQAVFYCLWANLHAGFITGVLLCACYFVGERLSRRSPRGFTTAGLALAGAAAALLNPFGWRIYAVVLDHSRHFSVLQKLILEWGAPELANKYLADYWIIAVSSLCGFLVAIRQGAVLPGEHLVAAVVFAALASRAVRTTSYFVLLVYPLSLYAWARAAAPRWWRPPLSVAAVALAAAFVVWRGAAVFVAQGSYARPVPLEDLGPRRAGLFLRREKEALSGLRLYNPYNWGGYFDYELWPDYKVFMDGRYLFADLLADVDDAQKNPDVWRDFLDDQGVELLVYANEGLMLLKKGIDLPHPYLDFSLPRKEWALVYWDQHALIYVRRRSVAADWLERREFRWLRPHDLRQMGFYIVAGAATYGQVSAEIDRYGREIDDARVLAQLKVWRGSFLRDLRRARPAASAASHSRIANRPR
ncbi:MAG: hypothetical protein ACHQ49_08570 [Elusimicrobiota bacterium]